MDRRVDGWKVGWLEAEWINGWVGEWMYAWIYVWMGEKVDSGWVRCWVGGG